MDTDKIKQCFIFQILAGLLWLCDGASALTVSSDISSSTTWTTDDSPILIDKYDFKILSNAILRIEAGVTVNVTDSFDVQGTLIISGTAENRVVFDEAASEQHWGPLKFSTAASEAYRTNTIQYGTFQNMDSYFYVSGQTLNMSHSSVTTTSSGSYGMATYVNSSSGNPASLTLVSNVFNITITQHNKTRVAGVILDGFPTTFSYNTFHITTTGTVLEINGLRMYRSNTTAFNAELVGNTITMDATLPGDSLSACGVHYESDSSGLASGNTIRVRGPQSLIGLEKTDADLIIDNTIELQSTATNSYGNLDAIKTLTSAPGTNDFVVNNKIDITANAPARYINGISCYAGRLRGNRIKIEHGGEGGYAHGINQAYYAGIIDGNTIYIQASSTALSVRGIYASTHYNTNATVYIRNNLLYHAGSTNSSGLYKDSGCAATIENEHNLIYGFGTAYSNCSAGTGALNADPLFIDNDLHLGPLSPAINAGTNQAWMSTAVDLDFDARIDQGVVDIGSDEYHVLISLSSTSASPVMIPSIPVTVSFSEPVGGFTASDVYTQNGTATNFEAQSTTNFTFTITPETEGMVYAYIPANTATNASGVGNSKSAVLSRLYNPNPPDLTISSLSITSPGIAAGTTFSVSVLISNATAATTASFPLSAWADHPAVAIPGETGDVTQTIASMSIGETRTVTLSGIESGNQPGQNTLRVFIDSSNVISESSETNNQQTLDYVVYGNQTFSLTAFALTNSVVLRWPDPVACGNLRQQTHLRYHPGRYPINTNDGTLCYSGTNQTYIHTNLAPGVTCYYTIWVTDDGTNFVDP